MIDFKIYPPTCHEIFQEELGDSVHRKDDASWRHGVIRTEVYYRENDNTYWQCVYHVSTDGETNGLREESAAIVRVWPIEVKKIVYTTTEPPLPDYVMAVIK